MPTAGEQAETETMGGSPSRNASLAAPSYRMQAVVARMAKKAAFAPVQAALPLVWKKSDAEAPKNPRVLARSSESVVGLKNDDLFANTGSRGDSPLWGVGQCPTKQTPNLQAHLSFQDKPPMASFVCERWHRGAMERCRA